MSSSSALLNSISYTDLIEERGESSFIGYLFTVRLCKSLIFEDVLSGLSGFPEARRIGRWRFLLLDFMDLKFSLRQSFVNLLAIEGLTAP